VSTKIAHHINQIIFTWILKSVEWYHCLTH
ncbi:hypothetical protein TorRG33x02_117300, partial [Trema orientale]